MQPLFLELSNQSDHPSENMDDVEAPKERSSSAAAEQLKTFQAQVTTLDQYFQVAEAAIEEMKATTDAKDMAPMSEADKRRDKQLDKKRSDALNTGQKTLRALNEQLKRAEKIVQ